MAKRGEDKLLDLLVDHRKCIQGVDGYICICGEYLPSNHYIRLAEHQVEIIEEYFSDGYV